MESIGAIFMWVLFGLVVGAIARMLYPGRQPMGYLATIALGVVGSLVGGFISWAIAGAPQDAFQPSGFIMSLLGALLVVFIYMAAIRPRNNVV